MMSPMPITPKQIQTFRHLYRLRYEKEISDQEALDIITRFLNLINIIRNNESRNNIRKKIY